MPQFVGNSKARNFHRIFIIKYNVPFFSGVAISNVDNKTEYIYEAILPRNSRLITNDRISPMLLVAQGFPVLSNKMEDMEVNVDERMVTAPWNIEEKE